MPKYPPEPFFIEYDRRVGKKVERVSREFTDPYAARRFWIAKDKAGKRPKVKKA